PLTPPSPACQSRARAAPAAPARETAMAVPNRILFVWLGTAFPYFCRLAVESALLHNPDAEVEIHIHGPHPDVEHFRAVAGYRRVSVHGITDLEALFGELDRPAERYVELFRRIPDRAASARSNLLRYGLLHRRGGVYVDFDVLFRNSLEPLLGHPAFIGQERVWRDGKAKEAGERTVQMGVSGALWVASYALRRIDAQVLGGRALLEKPARAIEAGWATYNQNNAVIGAEPGNGFIRRVLTGALDQSPTVRFALGPTLVTKVAAETAAAGLSDVWLCPEEVLYPVPPSCSFQFFHGAPPAIPPSTVLIHYVASNHKKRLAALTPETVGRGDQRSLFHLLATDVAERARSLDRA
ncbi:MAG: glycosyltransferase, partial [Myxococcota bacterium]